MTKKGGTMKEEILAAVQAISEKIRQLETAKRALEELLDSGPPGLRRKSLPSQRNEKPGPASPQERPGTEGTLGAIRRAKWPLRLPSITIDGVSGNNVGVVRSGSGMKLRMPMAYGNRHSQSLI